jgi:hypothetical protein
MNKLPILWRIGFTFLIFHRIPSAIPSIPTIAVGNNPDGRLELFYVNPDGFLCRRLQASPGGEWSSEKRFGGFSKGVTVAQNADGRLVVFFISADGVLYIKGKTAPDDEWADEMKFADAAKAISVARNADLRLQVFFIGADDVLYYRTQTEPGGTWADSEKLAGFAKTAAAGRNADGRLEIFYVGSLDSLYHVWQTVPGGGWSAGAGIAGPTKSVIVAQNLDGRLEAFFVGMDGVLRHKWQTGPNSGWSLHAVFADHAATTAVGRNHDGRLEVFFTDALGILRHKWQTEANGGWAAGKQFGWEATDVAAGTNADGRLETVYRGADGNLYHDWQLEPGLHWAGEYPFSSGDPPPFSTDDFNEIPNYVPPRPGWHVNDHCFIRDSDGAWHMFGIVAPNPYSGDLTVINWLGHAIAQRLEQNPWEEMSPPFYETLTAGGVVWAPYVIFHNGVYWMFYCAGGAPERFVIRLRTSPDLLHWSEPRVLFEDGFQARDPMVLWLDEKNLWAMYYTATECPDGGHHLVGVRTSSDLIHWSERISAYMDFHEGTSYGPTESPFVIRRGDWYYLFIGPRPYDSPTESMPNWEHPGYVGTDVFRGRRWDRWTNADYIGHIRAHAPEIVRDVTGDWYASHAGIHQGGFYLTRLNWNDGIDAVEQDPARTRGEVPRLSRLYANFPNPFNAETRIRFYAVQAEAVRITVLDAAGRTIRVLSDQVCSAGLHDVEWDGMDNRGIMLPSGVYFCVLRSLQFSGAFKMVLLR